MRILFLSAAILFAANFFGQSHLCGSTEAQNEWFAKHPELKIQFDKLQQEASDLDAEQYKTGYKQTGLLQKSSSAAAPIYTIPVVFHILHQGGTECISDAQVIDAVKILTRDYNKQNADTNIVVPQFTNSIGNAQIQFELATIDPNGNCTNGIIRHWDAKTNWTSNSFGDYTYSWPRNKYLNVYVVKTISSGAAGYTYLPGSGVPAAADAIVILSTYIGSIGTGNVGTSRALTHEVGHWLNLPHVWGSTNQPGVACGNDGVSDTPVTKGFTSCALTNAIICNAGITENVQNYMDYSYCSRMFTIGQAVRMNTALNNATAQRNNLSSPSNLAATGITTGTTNCIPFLDISALPSTTVCSGASLSLVSFTSNATPSSFLWTAGSGVVIGNTSAPATTATFNTVGTVTVNCLVSTASGSDNKTIVVTVLNGITEISSANSESFEAATLPGFWSLISPTNPTYKWDITNTTGSNGAQSMFVNAETFPANTEAILESPLYDFLNNPGAVYTFKYAYARQDANNKDQFKVQASKDCGGTWSDIWVPTTSALASGSGGTSSALFTPSASQWVLYDLTAHPNFINFLNINNVLIRFNFKEDVNGTGNGNRMYLDEINFDTPNGINEITQAIGLSVYPNPTNSVFNLKFNLSNDATVSYKLTSVTGATILNVPAKYFSAGVHEIKINESSKLAQGIYFLNFEMNGIKMTKKVIVN